MTSRFLDAVVDTLLPSDDGLPSLPSGTAVGVGAKLAEHLATGRHRASHEVVLEAIASAAGGEEAFMKTGVSDRVAAVQHVEAEMRGPFQVLLSELLQDYYEAQAVLLAMGWRAEPPQPEGHVLHPFDEALLEPVKRRGRMWR